MDLAVIILASTAVPILIYNAYWVIKTKDTDMYYGIFSGIYTFIGALFVSYGFPGNLIMPVSFFILALGGFHAFINMRNKTKLIKGIVFVAMCLTISVMQYVM